MSRLSLLLCCALLGACGDDSQPVTPDAPTGCGTRCDAPVEPGPDAAPDAPPEVDGAPCVPEPPGEIPDGGPTCGTQPASDIAHLVVVIQENHSFDSAFGRYCTAAAGSNPACNTGPGCCETAPPTDPGTGMSPLTLDDAQNGTFDPNHTQACELDEIHGGLMDNYIQGTVCGDARNFAISPTTAVMTYVQYAGSYALADRYFQPAAGQSSMNDMYFARARFVFLDNQFYPRDAVGSTCGFAASAPKMEYADPTIADLLVDCGVSFGMYIEGYDAMRTAVGTGTCPTPPVDCPAQIAAYPCLYDPSDIPFAYYPTLRDGATFHDLSQFGADVAGGTLPQVSFVKALGYKTEHPGASTTISAGMTAVSAIVEAILGSTTYQTSTLVLVTYDESGGFFDHVAPPPTSPVDCQPYGARVPLLAIGRFAKPSYVSHVTMEHSSIVRFIEWNWLGAQTGQLGNRDARVHNIGDLLANTGTPVPSD